MDLLAFGLSLGSVDLTNWFSLDLVFSFGFSVGLDFPFFIVLNYFISVVTLF